MSNRISILQNTLSKRSFEDFTVTLQPRDPEKKKKEQEKKNLSPPSKKRKFSKSSSILSIEHREKQVARMVGTSIPRQSSARFGILLARGWKDEGEALDRASVDRQPRLKKRLYGRKRRKNEEEGEEEASQIQLIEYRSNSSSSSSCFVFSPSFITETVDPPTWTNRAIRALYETAGYFARSRPLSRAPFPVWVERANKVSGAVLPWKRIGKEYRREEGW